MKLQVQPEAGLQPVLEALEGARTSIQILIFRLDLPAVERALVQAARRGVMVTALIAHTNRGGAKALRQLQARLRERGVRVFRTASDLPRYHGKMFLVDGRVLHLLAFNFTALDVVHSRSFAAITEDQALVREAQRLFDCDCAHQPYQPQQGDLVVSPGNARERLEQLLAGATQELLIYEMKLSDRRMLALLQQRAAAGVKIRILSRAPVWAPVRGAGFAVRLPSLRLHVRGIVRDRQEAFLGSMSLRRLELDKRREVGLLFRDPAAVERMAATFEQDWHAATPFPSYSLPGAAKRLSWKRWAKSLMRRLHLRGADAESGAQGPGKHTIAETTEDGSAKKRQHQQRRQKRRRG